MTIAKTNWVGTDKPVSLVRVKRFDPVQAHNSAVWTTSVAKGHVMAVNVADRQWALLLSYAEGNMNRVRRLAKKLGLSCSRGWEYQTYSNVVRHAMDGGVIAPEHWLQ